MGRTRSRHSDLRTWVYFQIAGTFGWSGTPAAFQVVRRAISWELKHAAKSSMLMFVDDISPYVLLLTLRQTWHSHRHTADPGVGRDMASKIRANPPPPIVPTDGVRQTVISAESQEVFSKFLKSSVQPSKDRKYELQWGLFTEFMKERGSDDPLMRDLTQQEKASMVSLFMISRYIKGKRGKAASAATAAIRLRFSHEILHTTFLDSRRWCPPPGPHVY